MSEGQEVKGRSQLDSTQEEAWVRKEGGNVCFFLLLPFISRLGGKRQRSPLDINIEPDDGLWRGEWVRPPGPPSTPGLWGDPCVSTFSCCCLIVQSL